MIVSVENGDMLKCNIENALKPANIDEEDSPTDAPRIYKPSLVIEVQLLFLHIFYLQILKVINFILIV